MIQFELSRTKLDLSRAVTKFNKLRQTPLGYRSQMRSRRDLSSLSQSGGHAKAQKRLARQLLGVETARRVHERNLEEGRSAQLHGDKDSQVVNGRVFASILLRAELIAALETPKMSVVGKRYVNYYLDKIGKNIGPEKNLETCDRNTITNNGYTAIYKDFKGAIEASRKGFRAGLDAYPILIK